MERGAWRVRAGGGRMGGAGGAGRIFRDGEVGYVRRRGLLSLKQNLKLDGPLRDQPSLPLAWRRGSGPVWSGELGSWGAAFRFADAVRL